MHRLLIVIAVSAAVVSIFSGCATPLYPQYLTDEFKSSVKSVSISKEVRFPDTMNVFYANNGQAGLIGAAIVGGMAERDSKYLNDQVKSKVDINTFISEQLRAGLADILRTNTNFTLVETNGQADAEFVFTVDAYGVAGWSKGFSGGRQISLTTSLMLIGHPPYTLARKKDRDYRLEPEDMTNNPVLWQRRVFGKGPRRNIGIDNFIEPSVTNDFFEAITNVNAHLSGALNEQPK